MPAVYRTRLALTPWKRRQHNAGYMRTANGKPVVFVADPQKAAGSGVWLYARPDDPSDQDCTWRELLVRYNKASNANPLDLLPAFKLYKNRSYSDLVGRFGLDKTYILSAGWGLINAGFLTPYYDISFSQNAETYKRGKRRTTSVTSACCLPCQMMKWSFSGERITCRFSIL
jgi:hypothetical protein